MADNKFLSLPIRTLPDGQHAVASLIINQASFAVLEGLSEAMAELARAFNAQVVIGLPQRSAFALAPLVAKHLGFSNFIALGYSRKFWYREELSVPLSSITTPDQDKRLYLDPDLIPRLRGAAHCWSTMSWRAARRCGRRSNCSDRCAVRSCRGESWR